MSTDIIFAPARAETLIGTWRRFGETGPVYQVVGSADLDHAGAPAMRVRVVETNEPVDYPLAAILDDPEEH